MKILQKMLFFVLIAISSSAYSLDDMPEIYLKMDRAYSDAAGNVNAKKYKISHAQCNAKRDYISYVLDRYLEKEDINLVLYRNKLWTKTRFSNSTADYTATQIYDSLQEEVAIDFEKWYKGCLGGRDDFSSLKVEFIAKKTCEKIAMFSELGAEQEIGGRRLEVEEYKIRLKPTSISKEEVKFAWEVGYNLMLNGKKSDPGKIKEEINSKCTIKYYEKSTHDFLEEYMQENGL